MAENAQPIIIKRVKKGGHGGHHGGSWKVAYADFVTAMMAFFLLLWLLNVSNDEILQGISAFFKNPSIVHAAGGASTSVISLGKRIDAAKGSGEQQRDSDEREIRDKESQAETALEEIEANQLQSIKEEIEDLLEGNSGLLGLKDQVVMDLTPEGLRIQIVDKKNRPMFDLSSARLKSYASKLLKEIAPILNEVPNKLSITGHTDGRRYFDNGTYGNWELSSDRANAARRTLIRSKLDPNKIARVTGMASELLYNPADPMDPNNRRISILVLNRKGERNLMNSEGSPDQVPKPTANAFTAEQLRSAVRSGATKNSGVIQR
ncbi:MAG: flagellar motor protein MotB [Gammaproteobacteria bacterium]|nr:flagellar motor protein MotB [Gammaproteobacteria bacterium]